MINHNMPMRFPVFCLAFLLSVLYGFCGDAVMFNGVPDKEAAMKRCCITVRQSCLSLWNGMPLPDRHAECADTLRSALYSDTLTVSLLLQVQGRLAIETYNLQVDSAKVNYKSMRAALNSCKNAESFYDLFFLNCALAVADNGMMSENYSLSEHYFLLALKAADTIYGNKRNQVSEYIHHRLVFIAHSKGNFDEAVVWTLLYLLDIKNSKGVDAQEFYQALDLLACALPYMADKPQAMKYYMDVINMLESWGKSGEGVYINFVGNAASMAAAQSDNAVAEELYGKLGRIIRKSDDGYVALMAEMACYYYSRREFEKMLQSFNACLEAFEQGYGSVGEFSGLLPVFNAPGVDTSAIERALAAVQRRVSPGNVGDMCTEVMALAKAGRIGDAYQLATEVGKSVDLQSGMTDARELTVVAGQMASMYSYIGDIDAAKELLKVALDAFVDSYGDTDMALVREQKLLIANYEQLSGDYHAGLSILEECLADSTLTEQERFSITKAMQAGEFGVGNYEKAITIADALLSSSVDSIDRWELLSGKAAALISLLDVAYDKESSYYADAMDELSNTVGKLGELCDSVFAGDQEYRLMQKIYGATASFLDNKDNRMVAYADSALHIIDNKLENPQLADTYRSSLATYYVKAGLYDKAEELLGESVDGEQTLAVERVFRNRLLCEIYLGRGDSIKARDCYVRHCSEIVSDVKSQFAGLTDGERSNYWRMFSRQISDAGRYADSSGFPSDFAAALYDMQLFSKGLLLNSTLSFERLVAGTPELEGIFRRYKNLRRSLVTADGIGESERVARLEEASKLEYSLITGSKAYGDFTGFVNAGWLDVRNALDSIDTAVEFVQYQDLGGLKYLGAVLVGKMLEKPVFVALGREEDVVSLIESDSDSSVIWDRMSRYFTVGGTVYFAAAGYLHSLPIESYYPGNDYSFCRFSSTRQLLRKSNRSEGDFALFGDPDFGNYGGLKTQSNGKREGGAVLDRLPATLGEIKLASRLWTAATGKPALEFADVGATKDAFVDLTHSGISMLHVATHGYFGNDGSIKAIDLPIPGFIPVNATQEALRESGLYFAGANNALGTDEVGNHCVNAAEISMLDFRNLSLVVLSACDTGAGAVTGEGVFGLQRGFKLAGAGAIMMSLWKVDDEATSVLMAEFYRNLLGDEAAGIKKHDARAALEIAKDKVKATPRWASPEFWAPFIILDAID